MLTTSVKVEYNRLPGLGQRLRAKTKVITREDAESVAAMAAALAAKDTGELANSIEAVASDTGYDVVVGAGHGPFVEYGTTMQAAQPYLTPAVEAHNGPFIGKMGKAVEDVA